MKNYLLPLCGLLFTACGTIPPADRLFVDETTLPQIRQAIQQPGSHHSAAFQQLKKRTTAADLSVYGDGVNRYNRSYRAQELAFLSLMATDPQNQRDYAQQAFEAARDIYEVPEQERKPHQGYGLSRAMMQQGLALPYAWCRQHWDTAQTRYMEGKINEALDAWPDYEHANFGHSRGSNWVAVCRGGEMVLLLAADQQEQRSARYQFLKEQLLLHMRNGYGSLGVSQEGIGYTEYGGQFLMKAIHATASRGDSALFNAARNCQWWKQAMYIGNFQPFDRKFLMTGVAGSSNPSEGWASLQLGMVPPEDLPYYLWWYNRHLGRQSVRPEEERYDHQRAGTVWSVLHYPLQVEEQDPTGHYPAMVADDHGYFFFRNRWKNEDDILLSLMADTHHHSHAWDQPEVFALNLMAHNARYVGGPSKERSDSLYSSLLVNGKYNIEGSVKLSGKVLQSEARPDGGFVAVDGGTLYHSLGLELAQRRMAVRFLPDNQALICLVDTVAAGTSQNFAWQLNLGDHTLDHGLEVSKEHRYFSLKSDRGQVEGWAFGPGALLFGPSDDPFRIHFSGKNECLVVLMLIHNEQTLGQGGAQQTAPGSFGLAGQQVRTTAEKIEIIADKR